MSHSTSRGFLHVCPVTQNSLAEAYLVQLLRSHRRLCPLNLREYARISPTDRKDTVFAIDQCGLDVPFCECVKQLRAACLNPKFLVVDREKSTEEIVRLLAFGAHGYIQDNDVSRSIIHAILGIAEGHLWVTPEVLREFLLQAGRALRKDGHDRQTTTPREDEILELVRRRLSNREIANMLQIRVSTVKFHLSNILSKMHANNRRDLIQPSALTLSRMLL
jgi:NarL family two-component system response regulator LiaR